MAPVPSAYVALPEPAMVSMVSWLPATHLPLAQVSAGVPLPALSWQGQEEDEEEEVVVVVDTMVAAVAAVAVTLPVPVVVAAAQVMPEPELLIQAILTTIIPETDES